MKTQVTLAGPTGREWGVGLRGHSALKLGSPALYDTSQLIESWFEVDSASKATIRFIKFRV